MNPDTEKTSQNQKSPQSRSRIICKGRKKRTTAACGEILCETDGANLFVATESGKELTINPNKKRGFGLICSECGFKTFWAHGMRGEIA